MVRVLIPCVEFYENTDDPFLVAKQEAFLRRISLQAPRQQTRCRAVLYWTVLLCCDQVLTVRQSFGILTLYGYFAFQFNTYTPRL